MAYVNDMKNVASNLGVGSGQVAPVKHHHQHQHQHGGDRGAIEHAHQPHHNPQQQQQQPPSNHGQGFIMRGV